MTTTRRDKGGAKPRQRASKTGRKAQKGEKQAATQRDQADQDSMAEIAPPMEPAPIVQAMIEKAITEQTPIEQTPIKEKAENDVIDASLSGEVLPPEIRSHVAAQPLQGIGVHSIVLAYLDYARKSWAAGQMLAERFIMARSIEQAVEVQGDFARQSLANFLVHSQQVSRLYVGFTRQFFRPL